jgi:dTDP-4-dehydrorhamnose reductase
LYNSAPRNCNNYNSFKADITNSIVLNDIFSSFKPEIVIHTAAISSPKKAAGTAPKDVYKINVLSTKAIAELCEKYKAKLIYTSTDLVYAGYRGSSLNEESKLVPISLYAETKLMGEQKIQDTFDNYIILRTALLFGFGLNGCSSHFQEMYNNLKNGRKVKLFTDQYRSPLSLYEAARTIEILSCSPVHGEIINFGGPERLSRYDLGIMLSTIAGLDVSLIEKISMSDLPDIPHVADVSMDISKLCSCGIKPQNIDHTMQEILINI